MKKNAILPGSSRGIGKQIALTFAKNGYDVMLNFVDPDSEKYAKEICEKIKNENGNAEYFRADVSDFSQAKALIDFSIQKFGTPDVLINNAGISLIKPLNDVSPDEWNKIINTNLSSVYNCSKAAMDCMISKKTGKIINIASMWGVCGASCEVPYSAAKAGVIGFTKALAKELAPSNINVNCVSPGVIMTDMMKCFSENELDEIKSEIPLERFGKADDIAEMCLFLASDKANYITGQNINVDGGVNI